MKDGDSCTRRLPSAYGTRPNTSAKPGATMTYEVLVIIVVLNVLATFSLWRQVASKSSQRPTLNKKAAAALWRGDPIGPMHDPPTVAGGQYSSLAGDDDQRFFADFMDFADVVNWWLADEFTASRFRLQDLPDGDLSLNVDFSGGPTLGRSFAVYYNQTRVGRLEVSPGNEYKRGVPETYTSVEISWARFFSFAELTEFLNAIAWHVTTGDANNADFRNAQSNINYALIRTLWEDYRVTEFDQAVDRADDFGELTLSLHGTATCYIHRRDAPARPRSR
jgi:hypothetical protein